MPIAPRLSRIDWAVAAAALIAGAASAVVLPSLAYDSWAWMVWAREVAHFDLVATGGPVIKPLPILIAAPVARFDGAAPFIWLSLARAAFLLCGWAAYRLGLGLGGPLAGALAAAAVLLVPGLFATAVQGYSEPLFVLLVILAALAFLSDRATLGLVALALAGLLRSEEWVFLFTAAGWAAATSRVRWERALILALAPPAVWLGMDWAGSGDPLRSLAHAAAGRGRTAGEELDHLINDLGAFNLIGSAAAAGFAFFRKSRPVALMLAAAVAWTLLVLGKGVAGYPVGARYLIPAAAMFAVCGGWGIAQTLASLTRRGPVAAGAGAILIAIVAANRLDPAVESVRTAHRQSVAGDGLERAIAAAGGRARLTATTGPTVMANTPMLTELAWRLGVPLSRVVTIWRNDPNERLKAPAIVFAAPESDAGPVTPIPPRFTTRAVTRAGRWAILELLPAPEPRATDSAWRATDSARP